jgi:tellurite resistance protein TerC
MDSVFFNFADYWHLYVWFSIFVLALLALDLGVFNRKAHVVSMKEAAAWSVVWVSLALIFNALLYWYCSTRLALSPETLAATGLTTDEVARKLSLEFLTGFVVEKSLAVDNLFIFVVVFTYFGIPSELQHRVLFFGIIGALVFRAIFIALGSVLMQYELIVMIFGVFLILTGIKLFFAPDKPADLGQNWAVKIIKKVLPVTDKLHGERFLVRIGNKLYATPLMLALLVVEASDIIFAVDSVPAIFALTKEPFIVFTSNVFAILGLRSLYFLLLNVYDRFHLLKYGLGVVLIFVGLKMSWLNELFGGKFPIGISLGFISTMR